MATPLASHQQVNELRLLLTSEHITEDERGKMLPVLERLPAERAGAAIASLQETIIKRQHTLEDDNPALRPLDWPRRPDCFLDYDQDAYQQQLAFYQRSYGPWQWNAVPKRVQRRINHVLAALEEFGVTLNPWAPA